MTIIEHENNEYPKNLKLIKDYPKKLYVEGNIDNLNTNCIAVVGSRNCTKYGEKWCKIFVKELVKYDITIVSGLALGIDSVAHNEAIIAGGKTIAVLPSGFNNIYPTKNTSLYKRILNNDGTGITEYLPDKIANSNSFLKRNRIVSGLSIATLVIEGAYRSGTSVTARFAKEQNREVYCIPRKFGQPKKCWYK